MKIQCGIYQIRNIINNKMYIGQSINIRRRWWEHKTRVYETDEKYNLPIYNAMRKYGIDNFEFTIIEECSKELLNEREAYYIKERNTLVPNGYNLSEQPFQSIFSKQYYCVDCNKIISKNHIRCAECDYKYRHQLWIQTIPISREELKYLIRTIPFTTISNQYNTSARTLGRWCKEYNLPYTKKDINSYTDEDWNKI